MKKQFLTILGALTLLTASVPGHAGLYADDMGRCLVSATSTKDKTDLVRWIFAVAALHPEVANIAAANASQRVELNRQAGKLFQRLLTEDCRKQTQEALKYEGAIAMQLSFQVLGQVAMQELMNHNAVRNGFSELSKYMDESKIKAIAPAAH